MTIMQTGSLNHQKNLSRRLWITSFRRSVQTIGQALEIWNNNPWVAVSMYEVHHYPENLQYSLAFPKGVEIPRWYLKKLQDEEMYALEGNPLYVAYPRAKEQTVELGDNSWEINRFGRVIYHETEEDDSDLR